MEQAAVAPGLKFVYDECLKIYPNQPDPLQAKSLIKMWQGGPDPLDYISMYKNPGNPDLNVPPHWHYVSYGLTDLYGDNRSHKRASSDKERSGFGFELTFRLKREPDDDDTPPVWPARLMQQLARYVFASGNLLWHGDHVSWHHPLDSSESRIIHMLMCSDSQLQPIQSPFGLIEFIQIVGITGEELDTVQQWNGPSFLSLMRRYYQCGGEYLVTDMRRGESLLDLDENIREEVSNGIDKDGSNLSGVTANCDWTDNAWQFYTEEDMQYLTPAQKDKIFKLQGYHYGNGEDVEPSNEQRSRNRNASGGSEDEDVGHDHHPASSRRHTGSSLRMSTGENVIKELMRSSSNNLRSSVNDDLRMSYESTHSNHSYREEPLGFGEIEQPLKSWEFVHVLLNLEASLLIPLALKGRLRHGRHFTFNSPSTNLAVTLVAPQVRGSYASTEHPFRSKGSWLHVCMSEELIEEILKDFESIIGNDALPLPKTLVWPQWNFALTIAM